MATPSSRPVSGFHFGSGFHQAEPSSGQLLRWIEREARLGFEPSSRARYLELWVWCEYHDLSQALRVELESGSVSQELAHGWNPISAAVEPGERECRLRASRGLPAEHHPGDPRELALRLREPRWHEDGARHDALAAQARNAALLTRELIGRKARLEATPVSLGIDLHGACNVKPPCVYCEWDTSKELEGDKVDAPFTLDTLRDYGTFFDGAGELVNCSIGEPFMLRELDALLDAFGRAGKLLEMSTNGQILTDRNIEKLLGRPVNLYISLDAATAETYARLRNNTFERILENLRRLVAAKGGRGALPHVYLVFMPMRANLAELDRFVALCAELEVDRLVLRPLNDSKSVKLSWQRAGYRFDYQRELLPFAELVRASGRAAELCRRHGVELSDQMDFGSRLESLFEREFARGREEAGQALGAAAAVEEAPRAPGPPGAAPEPVPPPSLGAEKLPLCQEPWRNLYILRRGVLPCCHGARPIAPMDGYREAWNGDLLQAIRAELGRGRFHAYCHESTTCPIVRKAAASGTLSVPLRRRVRATLGRLRRRLPLARG